MSRKTYVYRPQHPKASPNGFVDVDDLYDDLPEERGKLFVYGESHYEGATVPGTDIRIDSKKRHREYLRQNNLCMYDDLKGDLERGQREREKHFKGEVGAVERDLIGKAVYEAKKFVKRDFQKLTEKQKAQVHQRIKEWEK